MKRWIIRIFLALLVAIAAVTFIKREDISRLMAVNSLFAEEKIVSNFSNMDDLFLNTPLSRGTGPVSALPEGPPAALPGGYDDWVDQRNVTAVVVLHDGRLVHEAYYQGTNPEDLRIAWSVSKSWLSALFGILLDEGAIGSIEDPVTQYAPALIGSAYEDATIKDVLQMSSGVTFDEDYLNYSSDINKMGRVLALGGSMDAFAAGLTEMDSAPGKSWQYVSIDTHVLGMVVRGATDRSLADLLTEKLVQPLGLEADPFYLTDGYDVAFALGGLNIRARDNARFGQMIAQGGRWEGKQLVPAAWITEATQASANTRPGNTGYGYQWWIPIGSGPAQFMARGVYGQYIYIDQPRNVVVVTNGVDRQFNAPGSNNQNVAMFRAIAESFD